MLMPAIALLLWLYTFFNSPVSFSSDLSMAGPLGRLLAFSVSAKPVISSVLACGIILLYGYFLVQINGSLLFLQTRSQMPQFFYIVIAGGLFWLRYLSPAMMATLFVIIMIARIFQSFKKDKLTYHFLDAGIFLSIAVLIYYPAVFFFPVLLIALFLFRNTVWQEWFYPWIGFFLPALFWGSYLFLTDQPLNLIGEELRNAFVSSGRAYDFSAVQLAYYGYLALLVVIGSFHMIRTIGMQNIQSRVFFIFFFWLFVLSLITMIINASAAQVTIYIGGISLAYLLSYYFSSCKNNRFNNLLLFIMIAGIILVAVDEWFNIVPGTYSF